MKQVRSWQKVALSPVSVVLLLSLVFIVVNLFYSQRTRPYISDDVSWQTIFMTWHPFSGHTAYMGAQDNFVVNAPLLWLMGQFFSPSRTLLLIEAAIMACVNFALFYVACLYFLRKCKIAVGYFSLLPFLWLASFGYGLERLYLNTNWRNFNGGVSFIFFMLASMVYFGDIKPLKSRTSQAITVLSSLVAGVFLYSDPYFLYFTVVPIVAAFVVLYLMKKIVKKDLLVILGATLISFITAAGARFAIARAGLLSPSPAAPQFVARGEFINHVFLAIDGTLKIFGADFRGDYIKSLSGLTAVANYTLVAFIAYRAYRTGTSKEKSHSDNSVSSQIVIFLIGLCALVIAVFILSTNAVDLYSYRYLIAVVYAAVLMLAIFASNLRRARVVFIPIVATAIMCNMLSAFHDSKYPQVGAEDNMANSANYNLINAVKKLGLTKGYTAYPDGNINTFLSGDSIDFLPVTCETDGETQPLKLLVDGSLYKQKAEKTFIIPDNVSNPTCSERQIIAQFGMPNQSVWAGGETILIYNHDLVSNMNW
jgi:hypothetical protein